MRNVIFGVLSFLKSTNSILLIMLYIAFHKQMQKPA